MTGRATDTPICRAPHPGEMPVVRALLAEQASDPYVARALELLEHAAAGAGEYRAIAAFGAGERAAGVGIYGLVAGAQWTGAIHSLVGSDQVAMHALVGAMLRELEALRARLAVAEIADEPRREPLRAVMLKHGFQEESRVPDLYREGVALSFLRRDFSATR